MLVREVVLIYIPILYCINYNIVNALRNICVTTGFCFFKEHKGPKSPGYKDSAFSNSPYLPIYCRTPAYKGQTFQSKTCRYLILESLSVMVPSLVVNLCGEMPCYGSPDAHLCLRLAPLSAAQWLRSLRSGLILVPAMLTISNLSILS